MLIGWTAAAQEANQPAQKPVAVWDDRPSLRFGDRLRLDIHARVQTDVSLRDDTESVDDRVAVPRRRVGVEGLLFKRVEFQIERELQTESPWRDVYADVRLHPALRVRAGHFKIPFSLERLTSAYDLDFIARTASAADLAPNRQIGIMVHGRPGRRLFKYEVGIFQHADADGADARDTWRTLAGRVTIPLLDGRGREQDLRLGLSMVRSNVPEGPYSLPAQLVMGDRYLDPIFVNGRRARVGVDGEWDYDRVSIKGEWMRVADARDGQGIANDDLSDLVTTGAYGSLVWQLARTSAGKDRTRSLVDLGARFERTRFGSAGEGDPVLHPRAAHVAPVGADTWTFGTTWHVNRWVKVQANGVHEEIVDPFDALRTAAGSFWSSAIRLQFSM